MLEPVFLRNTLLRTRLSALLEGGGQKPRLQAAERVDPILPLLCPPSADSEGIDVVITMNEVTDKHGTGPLVKRVYRSPHSVFSIRTRDDWGVQEFGRWDIKMSHQGCSRPEWFRNVLSVLGGRKVRSVLCIPFLIDEIQTSIAIKEAFGAPLCAWIMDDQNVAAEVIPDGLMSEFLEKCSLRLATHPELRQAYQSKYGLPFYILPAIVPARLTAAEPAAPQFAPQDRRGALLGSFWDQSWFDRLCSILERSGYHIDWFGNNKSPWLKFPKEALDRAGITAHGVVPEERLAAELRKYPFAIVPAGALELGEMNKGVASLSLPGRILFAAATAHTPVLLVGSRQTCGAHFVEHFGIGEVVPYDAGKLRAAMERMSDPAVQEKLRARAAAVAANYSDRGVPEWLESSIRLGRPADNRFEDAFAGYNVG